MVNNITGYYINIMPQITVSYTIRNPNIHLHVQRKKKISTFHSPSLVFGGNLRKPGLFRRDGIHLTPIISPKPHPLGDSVFSQTEKNLKNSKKTYLLDLNIKFQRKNYTGSLTALKSKTIIKH